MTDMTVLSQMLFERIEWQRVPETIGQEALSAFIADGIRYLYVVTGRALQFSEDLFTKTNSVYTSFENDMQLDEREYVLVTAEIGFYQKVQTDVSDLVSYTTNALSVAHGDKPFANLQKKIEGLQSKQTTLWYKMVRYHML